VHGLINEMKSYVDEFRRNEQNESMDEYWTRKSQQHVLAIVQCELADGVYTYYKGRNIELSLAVGSQCAERSALGTAVSSNLNLSRKDFKRIAVIDPTGTFIGRTPCGVCSECLQKIQEESPEFCVVTFPDDEFKCIHEHFPAEYPVEVVDAEQTQKALEQEWICHSCDSTQSGYSTQCWLCGSKKSSNSHRYNTLFQSPTLVKKTMDIINDNYSASQRFSCKDILKKNGLIKPTEERVINNLLFHLASSRRQILTRHHNGKKKKTHTFSTKQPNFDEYRKSLHENL